MLRLTYDSIIVGCGPAGMTAALQLRRTGHMVLCIERSRPGGLLLHAGQVENYPGTDGSPSGEDLAALFLGKLRAFGVEPVIEEVLDWRKEGGHFVVSTNRASYKARTLVLATGTRPLDPPFQVQGANCLHRFSNDFLRIRSFPPASVIIVGGGDAAFDYALSLSSRGWKVTLVFRKDRPSALKLLVDMAFAAGITVLPAFLPEGVECRKESVFLVGVERGEKKTLEADYVLTAIGRRPEDGLLKAVDTPANLMGEVGQVPGLFVAGDVRRSGFRQAVIAAGDGMASAMAAARYLAEHGEA